MKTFSTTMCLILVLAVAGGCANRACNEWPGTCIIQ
ncbi:Hypothetical protein OINT_2000140 [Brucella intermedia LMG 3301]|uniref:Lipoprotein n=1 Tax=Brucella intermedia LMG 3301 TaxID=641118 RepID=C4WLM9_9HYPH|nr:Hypothetical protein OINT_2000140 [Brucella intermedia LMG 3301]